MVIITIKVDQIIIYYSTHNTNDCNSAYDNNNHNTTHDNNNCNSRQDNNLI